MQRIGFFRNLVDWHRLPSRHQRYCFNRRQALYVCVQAHRCQDCVATHNLPRVDHLVSAYVYETVFQPPFPPPVTSSKLQSSPNCYYFLFQSTRKLSCFIVVLPILFQCKHICEVLIIWNYSSFQWHLKAVTTSFQKNVFRICSSK